MDNFPVHFVEIQFANGQQLKVNNATNTHKNRRRQNLSTILESNSMFLCLAKTQSQNTGTKVFTFLK